MDVAHALDGARLAGYRQPHAQSEWRPLRAVDLRAAGIVWSSTKLSKRGVVMIHICHAIGCTVVVPPRLLMHLQHWRMVPKDLQRAVWAAYRQGQEQDKRPSKAYLQAAARAIIAVAEQEQRPIPPAYYKMAGSAQGTVSGYRAELFPSTPGVLHDTGNVDA